MFLAVLLFSAAIANVDADASDGVGCDFKCACENKVAGDKCEYVTNIDEACCSMIKNQAGNMEKFCRQCDKPGAKVYSECSIHSRNGYLACFSNANAKAVFQVCVGQKRGSDCMYETPASSRGGKTTPAYNTTGHCISHYSSKEIMCLEAVGDEDDGECHGKGVGEPCKHDESPNAVCAHHSRRGNWMCLRPKEENMVFVVCQGREKDTPCSWVKEESGHGVDQGLHQGVCYPHHETGSQNDALGHDQMMCMDPEDLKKAKAEEAAEEAAANGDAPASSAKGQSISIMAVLGFGMSRLV